MVAKGGLGVRPNVRVVIISEARAFGFDAVISRAERARQQKGKREHAPGYRTEGDAREDAREDARRGMEDTTHGTIHPHQRPRADSLPWPLPGLLWLLFSPAGKERFGTFGKVLRVVRRCIVRGFRPCGRLPASADLREPRVQSYRTVEWCSLGGSAARGLFSIRSVARKSARRHTVTQWSAPTAPTQIVLSDGPAFIDCAYAAAIMSFVFDDAIRDHPVSGGVEVEAGSEV